MYFLFVQVKPPLVYLVIDSVISGIIVVSEILYLVELYQKDGGQSAEETEEEIADQEV